MSESKVVPFGSTYSSPEPVESVIKLLERLLEEARRGELRGLVVSTVDGGGGLTSVIEYGSSAPPLLLAGVNLLQHRMLTSWGHVLED